jgi:hypothetical protein
VWDPAPAQLETLGAAGRAFLARMQAAGPLSLVEGEIAIQGAHTVDRLEELRARRGRAPVKAREALDRMELAQQRALTGCLLALRVRTVVAAAPARKWGKAL